MTALTTEVSAILKNISDVAQSLEGSKPGARESLISLSHELITALELPSEAIQRIGWAEVSFFFLSSTFPPRLSLNSCPRF